VNEPTRWRGIGLAVAAPAAGCAEEGAHAEELHDFEVATPLRLEVLDRKHVFVVDEQGVGHARLIVVAQELPHSYVVAEGLEEGERVLLEGLRRVGDGDRISPVDRDPSEVLSEQDLPAE